MTRMIRRVRWFGKIGAATSIVAVFVLSGFSVAVLLANENHDDQLGADMLAPVSFKDLVVYSIWWRDAYGAITQDSPTFTSGQPFTVYVTIRNSGSLGAGGSVTALFLDGLFFGEVTTPALSGGSSFDAEFANVYASEPTAHSVKAIADYTNLVYETNMNKPSTGEKNNEKTEGFSIVKADWSLAVIMAGDSPMMFEREYYKFDGYNGYDMEGCVLDDFGYLAKKDFTIDDESALHHAGSNSRLSIAAMMDMRDGIVDWKPDHYVGFYDGWTDTKLFFVYPGCTPMSTNALPAKEWPSSLTPGELDLANPTTIAEFGKWAFTRFQSNHQFIVMRVFGASWFGISQDLNGAPVTAAPSDMLTPAELADSLSRIRQALSTNIDVLGLDGCFGGALELVAGLSSSVDVVLSHEGLEPEENENPGLFAHSWPYHILVDSLRESPPSEMDTDNNGFWSGDEFANWMTIADGLLQGPYPWQYSSIYSDAARGCLGMKHIAAYRTSNVDALVVPAVNNLADVLMAKISVDPSFRDTLWAVRERQDFLVYVHDWFWYTWSDSMSDRVYMHRAVDVANLAGALKPATNDQEIVSACDAVLDAFYSTTLRRWGWDMPIPGNSPGDFTALWKQPCGLSIYWPETISNTMPLLQSEMQNVLSYGAASFSGASRWDDFLCVYYEVPDNPPTAPGVPSLIRYTDSFDGSYTLNWQPAEDTDFSGIAEYRLSELHVDETEWHQVWTGSSNSCTLAYRYPGNYYYMVRAVDTQGKEGPWSGVSDPVVVPWDTPLTNSLSNPSGPSDTSQTPVAAPAIAADALGFYHVVWVDSRDGNNEIYYRRADDSWNVYGKQPTRISSDTRDSISPRIAVTSTGVIKVVWADSRSSSPLHSIWSRTFSQGGWGPETEIFVLRTFDLREPDVVVDSADKFHYIYRAVQRDSSRELEHNRIYYSGESLSPVQLYKYSGFCDRDMTPLSFPLPVNMLRSARLAIEYSGERHVVFVQGPLLYESGSSTLYYLRYFAGKWEQPRVVVSSDSCSEPFRYMMRCDIAVDGYGRLFAVCDTSETWLGATVLTCHISDDNGNSWSRVFDYFVSSLSNVEVSVDSHGGIYLACDCKIPPFFIRHQVFCAVSFDFGITWSGLWEWESQVSYPPIIGESRWPCLCVNPKSGAVGLAWFDTRDGFNAIYFAARCFN